MEGEPSCSRSNDELKYKQYDSDDDEREEPKNTSDETSQDQKIDMLDSETTEDEDPFYIPNMPEDYKETYQAFINQVVASASIPLEESITPEHIKNFKHFNLRYYEDRYCINALPSEAGYNDTLIRIHSNKMFLISLASGNDIIRCGKPITAINFMINNSDRSNIKLGGKKKRGAKVIERHTILCQVKCDGIPKMFNIRAGIPGRIIEINEHVKADPNLLKSDPKGYGYLAVVAPKGHPSNYEKILTDLKLLNEEEYYKYLLERPPKFSEVSQEVVEKITSQ